MNQKHRPAAQISAVVLAATAAIVVAALAGCGEPSTTTAVSVDPPVSEDAGGFQPFDVPPVLVDYAAPEYPKAAHSNHVEGTIVVKVFVGTDGRVERAEVLRGGNASLESAALAASAKWAFKPAMFQGKPTRSVVAVPVQFRL